MTDAQRTSIDAARATLVAAMRNFVTSTLPPNVTAVAAAIQPTVGPMAGVHPIMTGQPGNADAQFYRACVMYMNQLRAEGATATAPLPFP